MIWLASFPRSGNTYIRNILFEVYGIESSAFTLLENTKFKDTYMDYQVVKTHLMPSDLEMKDVSIPVVCLVRDGRDAVVSLAHHRSDIIEPGSSFRANLRAAIQAKGGSFFGGWSKNIEAWLERADLVIRYEDLIKDPIGTVEKFRPFLDLPEPQVDKLPDFETLKHGVPRYGHRKSKERNAKFFRKGIAGSWKEDMNFLEHQLFWLNHGKTMKKLGYQRNGDIKPIKEVPLLNSYKKDMNDHLKLISIHIPKTAGTSFRKTLETAYGENRVARLDIRDMKPPELKEVEYEGPYLPKDIEVIHGHFTMSELKKHFHINDHTPVMVWLRHPVELVISNYFYLSKQLKGFMAEEHKDKKILNRMGRSLEEYAVGDFARNRMSKFLNGIDLESLHFVGIQEYFTEDLSDLAKLMGWSNYKEQKENIFNSSSEPVDEKMRKLIEELNQEDMKLYQHGLELREERRKRLQ